MPFIISTNLGPMIPKRVPHSTLPLTENNYTVRYKLLCICNILLHHM